MSKGQSQLKNLLKRTEKKSHSNCFQECFLSYPHYTVTVYNC